MNYTIHFSQLYMIWLYISLQIIITTMISYSSQLIKRFIMKYFKSNLHINMCKRDIFEIGHSGLKFEKMYRQVITLFSICRVNFFQNHFKRIIPEGPGLFESRKNKSKRLFLHLREFRKDYSSGHSHYLLHY